MIRTKLLTVCFCACLFMANCVNAPSTIKKDETSFNDEEEDGQFSKQDRIDLAMKQEFELTKDLPA